MKSPKIQSWRVGSSSFFLKEWEELPLSVTVRQSSEDITAATVRKRLSCPDSTTERYWGAARPLQTGNKSLDLLEVL